MRKILSLSVCLVVFGVYAANQNPLLGVWVESYGDKSKLIWEIKADSISYYEADLKGERLADPQTGKVRYNHLGPSQYGDTYSIQFVDDKGEPELTALAYVKSASSIVLKFGEQDLHVLNKPAK